jgi:hypothetical protein
MRLDALLMQVKVVIYTQCTREMGDAFSPALRRVWALVPCSCSFLCHAPSWGTGEGWLSCIRVFSLRYYASGSFRR